MSDVSVFIAGERELALKFEQFPQELRAALKDRITGLTEELAARVRAAAPKGKTGKLEASIESRVRDSDQAVTGVVFVDSDFAKAGALEYGAHRPTKVFSSESRSAKRLLRELGLRRRAAGIAPEYIRTPNIAAHRFIRGPAASIEAEVQAELQDVVDKTLSEDL